uniref:Tafazzin family protein n=1 Tax=Tetraselmis sp. GSL018 TaxID=582737 RepID=A0A061RWE6_9CHLO
MIRYQVSTATDCGIDPVGAFQRLWLRFRCRILWFSPERNKTVCRRARGYPSEIASSADLVSETLGENGLLRRLVLCSVSRVSRAFMLSLTNTKIHGADRLASALERPSSVPLITVSNHVAAIDDPMVLASALPLSALDDPHKVRWTMCASDRCFKGRLTSAFFRAGKVLRTERGGGLQQPAMWAAEDRLSRGEWVHIFPEGTRSRDNGRTLGRVKWDPPPPRLTLGNGPQPSFQEGAILSSPPDKWPWPSTLLSGRRHPPIPPS